KDYHTALIADLAGREDLAVSSIASAAAADGAVLQLIVANARILARAGQREEALESIRNYLVIQPNNVSLVVLEKTLEGDTDIAPVVASSIEGAAEVLHGLGGMIGTDNGVELSAAYLQLALYLTPESHMTKLALGQVLVSAERCGDAIAIFEQIPTPSEHRRSADIQSGFCLDLLERPDEAVDRLQGLLETDPGDLDVVVALGNVLSGRERYGEAAKVYTAGIDSIDAVTPVHWQLFYRRGIAHERSKNWPEAEADLRKALELNPDQPSVLNYLGYSWVDMGRNLDEGLDMIRSAAEQRPNDGFIIDSLGWAYYRLGRYEEAVVQLERAVELRPEDPVLNDHLGDAYWKVGRRLEAVFQWNHARDLEPEPENLELIVKKLESGLVADGGNDG
ncbi:MAG: tetratricopeptide repeat protein, partial [Hyphomicrobiales bacterium]|nr:tetratricopeptide repeat protein [Hyphomicrobiales bacterium]